MEAENKNKSVELFRTLVFDYSCNDASYAPYLTSLLKTNDNVNNFMFNRMADSHAKIATKDLEHIVFDKMNNISNLPKYFVRGATYDARAAYDSYEFNYNYKENNREDIIKALDDLFNKGKITHNEYHHKVSEAKKPVKVHFGSKDLYYDRLNGNISHEDFIEERYRPLNSIGEANQNGNRFFDFYEDGTVIFKPDKKHIFRLVISNMFPSHQVLYSAMCKLANEGKLSVTVKLTLNTIHFTCDFMKLYELADIDLLKKASTYHFKVNRIAAIDMNPNYIGFSIIQWYGSEKFKVLYTNVYSFKEITDEMTRLKRLGYKNSSDEMKYLYNKLEHEVIEVAIQMVRVATGFNAETFALEDLKIKSKDAGKGKNYNELVNNKWLRTVLVGELEKMSLLSGMKFQKVMAEFSSVYGNFKYRQLRDKEGNSLFPDMVCASIEISRRAYEFVSRYINKTTKDKDVKRKVVVKHPYTMYEDLYVQSLEEFNILDEYGSSIEDIYYKHIKSGAKVKVRVGLDRAAMTQLARERQFCSVKSKIK